MKPRGWSMVPLIAVLASLFSVISIETKAMAERLKRMRNARYQGLGFLSAWRFSGMVPIAGGSGAPPSLDDVKEAIKASVVEVIQKELKPINERLTAIEGEQKTLGKEVVRFDATGKRFKWDGGEAPSFVKSGVNNDSKPLMLSNVWRAVARGGMGSRHILEQYAPEELAMSDRLAKAGYQSDFSGSLLLPLSRDLLVLEDEGEADKLRKEIGDRMELKGIDPGEIGWLVRKHYGNDPSALMSLGLNRKDMQVGDDSLGGILIPSTQSTEIIDLLRNRLSVMRAGATEIALPPTGNISYPRLNSDPSFSYADPDTTTDASTTQPGTGVIRMQAKSCRGFVTIPNDLLRYSSPSVEMVVRNALAMRFAVVEDNQAIEGVGSTLAPKGILNYPQGTAETPAVNKVTLHVATTTGTNGDTFAPEDVFKMFALYYMGNDPDPPTAWIMRPLLWSAIFNRRADAVTAGDAKGPFMFNTYNYPTPANAGNGGLPQALSGIPVIPTVQASANRTKGSGTTLVYAVLGNFRRLIIGRVGTLELAVSDHVKFLQDKIVIRAVGRHDFALQHEESFCVVDTLLES
jgi:HK97 family phage major capsid protein